MLGYNPDVILSLPAPDGELTVHLAKGGEQFPWAAHQGRVIIGPGVGESTSDGTPMDSLEWQVNDFWVIDALSEDGVSTPLDPAQYAQVVEAAEGCKMRHPNGSEAGTCRCRTPNECLLGPR
jgi:hypothetical protein